MTDMNRRAFLRTTAATALASSVLLTKRCFSAQLPLRKFIMNLNVGQIGVKATPLEAVRLARQHGYGAVTPMTGSLIKYSEAELGQLLAEMKSNGIVWGAGVLSPFFEPNDTGFKDRLTEVRRTARLTHPAGVTRCFTWTMSSSNTRTYLAIFRLHTPRAREVG
ncbi:MAG: hypothetical protein NTX52_12645, partial [Planctomycetota bacterium]|nr:hypothetical protein [Planctomycetota bacterium]